jgi:hypothetical protein
MLRRASRSPWLQRQQVGINLRDSRAFIASTGAA